ncbi:MAG: HdeD family acid-resistance protein [Planctomycetaceae bacterium]
MLQAAARNWWVLLLRGICAILFGIMAFAWPGMTFLVLVIMYGAYALVDGVASIALGLSGRGEGQPWLTMVLVGILGILVGLIAFFRPGIAGGAMLLFIAIAAIAHGILEIIAAIRLRKVLENEWLLILAGASLVLFGILILMRPDAGAVTIAWLIGTASVAFGVLCVALSLRLRSLNERIKGTTMPKPA